MDYFLKTQFKYYQFQKSQNDYDVSKVFQNNEKDGLLSLRNICKLSFKEMTKAARNLRLAKNKNCNAQHCQETRIHIQFFGGSINGRGNVCLVTGVGGVEDNSDFKCTYSDNS